MKNNWKCKFTEAIRSIKYAWSFPHNWWSGEYNFLRTFLTWLVAKGERGSQHCLVLSVDHFWNRPNRSLFPCWNLSGCLLLIFHLFVYNSSRKIGLNYREVRKINVKIKMFYEGRWKFEGSGHKTGDLEWRIIDESSLQCNVPVDGTLVLEVLHIDLITDLEAILSLDRKASSALEIALFGYENLMSNNFCKTAVLKMIWIVN